MRATLPGQRPRNTIIPTAIDASSSTTSHANTSKNVNRRTSCLRDTACSRFRFEPGSQTVAFAGFARRIVIRSQAKPRRIGPKSNTEPLWGWGSLRPLFIDARKSNEYRTGNDTGAILTLLGGRKFESTEMPDSVSGAKIQALPPHWLR